MKLKPDPIYDRLKRALLERPFSPFTLVAANGKRYPVTRIAQAAASRSRVAYLSRDEILLWLKLSEIAAIEPIRKRAGSNGRGTSR